MVRLTATRYVGSGEKVRLRGGVDMVDEKITIQDASEVDPNLLRMLDRGLEDIEAGRILSHEAAMAEVRRIREARRFARSNTGVVANA